MLHTCIIPFYNADYPEVCLFKFEWIPCKIRSADQAASTKSNTYRCPFHVGPDK